MTPPPDIAAYIAGFPPEVQAVLQRIRATVRAAAPDAQEKISYRIPAFFQGGVLVYFAAFNKHIGLYPPVQGDARLERAVAKYAGEKGNLRFPLDEPMPYALIERIVAWRLKCNLANAAGEKKAAANRGFPLRRKGLRSRGCSRLAGPSGPA